jgi:hypothetical protein
LERHIHIVSFDVPWPVSCGGTADIFSIIKSMHQAGVKVHLHCFENGHYEQEELENYCSSVEYYPRLTGHKCVSMELPYTVAAGSSPALVERLLQDDHPILLQGILCTYLLTDDRFKGRRIAVRLLHTEYQKYRELSESTSPIAVFKKLFYRRESRVMREYEKQISDKALFLACCRHDADQYRQEFNAKNVVYLPPLLPYSEVTSEEGVGCYTLYHGNLTAPSNEKAALWLLDRVFKHLNVPFIVAGKNPSKKLMRVAMQTKNACIVANPSEQELQDMIRKAHIHVLPSLCNHSGQVKLLNALYNGRHVVVNDDMIADSALAPCCHIASGPEAFQSIIVQLRHKPFEEHEIKLRKHVLDQHYNTEANSRKLMQFMWSA